MTAKITIKFKAPIQNCHALERDDIIFSCVLINTERNTRPTYLKSHQQIPESLQINSEWLITHMQCQDSLKKRWFFQQENSPIGTIKALIVNHFHENLRHDGMLGIMCQNFYLSQNLGLRAKTWCKMWWLQSKAKYFLRILHDSKKTCLSLLSWVSHLKVWQ